MRIEDILHRAKDLISKGAIKGASKEVILQAIEETPDGLEEFLKEIAQQANDEHSRKGAIRMYSPELVGLAMAFLVSKKEAEDNPKKSVKSPVSEMVHTKLRSMLKS
jgi:hypothetical protein